MTVLWQDLKAELLDRLGNGVEALWSLLYAAQSGVFALSLITPLDEDFSLSDAATDLMLALDELECARPELLLTGFAMDLGPVGRDDLTAYRQSIQGLLSAAKEQLELLLKDGLAEFETPAVLALAATATLTGSAQRRLSEARQ